MSLTFGILHLLLVAASAVAHCQLAWPYPLHSPLNPANPNSIKDYSMTSPLVTDGTYPCKGFINNPSSGMDSVDTYAAGSSMNYTIAGTATHGGGSCQISMSYDLGQTWSVIFSQIGGCLIDGMTTTITIPTDAPSGEALFSWSWFNLLGNREMYQNCAVVTITEGGNGLSSDKYPTPFVANAGVNECVTIENTAVIFPNPGSNVQYGGSYASSKPTTPAGFTGTNCVGPGATSSDGGTTTNSTIPSVSSSTSTANIPSASGNSVMLSSTSMVEGVASASSSSTSINASSSSAIVASPTMTTLWTVPSSTVTTPISIEEASGSISQSSSAISAQATQCKRSKKRSSIQRTGEKRHQRLVRRRVAASKAEHISV